jgi:hypothetical protein
MESGGQPESQVEHDEVRGAQKLFWKSALLLTKFCCLRGLYIAVMYNNEVPIDEAFPLSHRHCLIDHNTYGVNLP